MNEGEWTRELTQKAQGDLAALESHEQERILDKLDESVTFRRIEQRESRWSISVVSGLLSAVGQPNILPAVALSIVVRPVRTKTSTQTNRSDE